MDRSQNPRQGPGVLAPDLARVHKPLEIVFFFVQKRVFFRSENPKNTVIRVQSDAFVSVLTRSNGARGGLEAFPVHKPLKSGAFTAFRPPKECFCVQNSKNTSSERRATLFVSVLTRSNGSRGGIEAIPNGVRGFRENGAFSRP